MQLGTLSSPPFAAKPAALAPKKTLKEVRSRTCYGAVRTLVRVAIALEIIALILAVAAGLRSGAGGAIAAVAAVLGGVFVLIVSLAAADLIFAIVDMADLQLQYRADHQT